MALRQPAAIPFWLPFALIALVIAWPTADRVRAADEAGELIVADLRADELVIVDRGTEAILERISLPGAPHELLSLPDGRTLVSIEQHGLLVAVDVERVVVEQIPVGGVPHGLALDGDTVLVTDRDTDQVRRFEIGSWHERTPITVDRWPHAVAVTATGAIAVAAALADTLTIGDRTHEVSALPETVSLASDGAIATAGAVGGELHVFAEDGTEELRIFLGGRPVRVLFAPHGELVAVALSAEGAVALVARDGTVRRVAVPGVPDGLAFNAAGDRLYVSDVVGGGAAVVDTVRAELVSVLDVGTATGALLVR